MYVVHTYYIGCKFLYFTKMRMKIEFITAHYYSYYSKTSILEYQLVSSKHIPKSRFIPISRSPFWEKFMKNVLGNYFLLFLCYNFSGFSKEFWQKIKNCIFCYINSIFRQQFFWERKMNELYPKNWQFQKTGKKWTFLGKICLKVFQNRGFYISKSRWFML